MKKTGLFLILPSLFFSLVSYSQGVQITPPKLEFDGSQLQISYGFIGAKPSDQFYVWLEAQRINGEIIILKSLKGDFGTIKGGKNKQITWIPSKDSIFLNEAISVEVKAEKYEKLFNKSSMMLLSAAMPGLGKTRLSYGKPYWLIAVAAYGSLAGGIIAHQSYSKTYDSYRVEEDPLKRQEMFNKAQKQSNISGVLLVSGAALWIADLIWVAATPNKYKPLKHVNLSINQSGGPVKGPILLSLSLNIR
jgi:membrane protein YqaA with SNARE-associated domain